MYRTTICALSYINIISIHITYNAADIANYIFTVIIGITKICSDSFPHKVISKTSAGCHNVAAVINAVSNGIMRSSFVSIITNTAAKITCYAAYIMRAADFVFLISCICNIGVNSTANYTAYITSIIKIIASLLSAAYIASISYIFYCTTVRRTTSNTTDVSNIYIYRNNTVIKRAASRKIIFIRYICMIIIFIC